MKQLFKWGIIGPGHIAEEFVHDMQYATGIQHIPHSILGRDKEKARIFADKYHASHHYDNIQEMLREGGLDAVYIATPHPYHHKETIICLENSIPVLCEKPFAINGRQVHQMVTISRKYNTFLMEGMWIRFLPSIQKVLDLCQQHIIGEIVKIDSSLSFLPERDKENRYYNPDLGGGTLLDIGIYGLYLASLLLGFPSHIHAFARLTKESVDEYCLVMLEYSRRKTAICESSFITKTDLSAVIYGTNGKIMILPNWNEKPTSIEVELHDGTKTSYPCDWEGRGFQFEMDEVYTCVQNQKTESALHSHKTSLQLMEIMDTIRTKTGIKYPYDDPVAFKEKTESL
jgi:predicted dehydrogenase